MFQGCTFSIDCMSKSDFVTLFCTTLSSTIREQRGLELSSISLDTWNVSCSFFLQTNAFTGLGRDVWFSDPALCRLNLLILLAVCLALHYRPCSLSFDFLFFLQKKHCIELLFFVSEMDSCFSWFADEDCWYTWSFVANSFKADAISCSTLASDGVWIALTETSLPILVLLPTTAWEMYCWCFTNEIYCFFHASEWS